jgi:hypothetical protein
VLSSPSPYSHFVLNVVLLCEAGGCRRFKPSVSESSVDFFSR